MTAALMLVFSAVALIQFAISQWRSIWITVASQPLSENIHAATGIYGDAISAGDFELLARTTEKLCPLPRGGNKWLREVRIYYRIVRALEGISAKNVPALAGWAKNELVACSRYAAAILDQRLNANLEYAAEVRSL
ncbi:MAG: hypothetical protein WBP79_17245 [Candidatus Acidiferrales bacterium]